MLLGMHEEQVEKPWSLNGMHSFEELYLKHRLI